MRSLLLNLLLARNSLQSSLFIPCSLEFGYLEQMCWQDTSWFWGGDLTWRGHGSAPWYEIHQSEVLFNGFFRGVCITAWL